jgi:lysozyme
MSRAIEEAVKIAEPMEGFSSTPYLDPVKIWTIGYGSTRDINNNPVNAHTAPVTRAQGEALMMRDMLWAEKELYNDVKSPLTLEEAAALEDFIYNVGAGNFRSSTLLKKLNAGDHAGAALEFQRWNQAKGVVLAGLVRRRAAEKAEFLKTAQ